MKVRFQIKTILILILGIAPFLGMASSSEIDSLNALSYTTCSTNPASAAKLANSAYLLSVQQTDSVRIAKSLLNIGRAYYYQDYYTVALTYDLKALEIYNLLSDTLGIAATNRNIGSVYLNQAKNEKAIEHYRMAFNLFTLTNDSVGQANCMRGIGSAYMELNRLDSAVIFINQALVLFQKYDQKRYMASCYTDLGIIRTKQNRFTDAFASFKSGLDIKEKLNDSKGICISKFYIGLWFEAQKNYLQALQYFNASLELAQKVNSLYYIQRNYGQISDIYSKIGNYKVAFEYNTKFKIASDSLHSQETNELELVIGFEKETAKLNAVHKQMQNESEHQLSKAKATRNIFIVGVFVLIIMVALIYWNLQIKKKANLALTAKNKVIANQNIELQEQRDFVMRQGDKIALQSHKIRAHLSEIQTQKKEITDSIHYASYIQHAIMPSADKVNCILPNSFIFYQPKDIVSGDFYWLYQTNNHIYVAAVDCTGHGVPGAFMSIVGQNGLNRAIMEKNISNPGEILNSLNQFVTGTLNQESQSIIRDGMDLALCKINRETHTIEFAGAKNPLYWVRPIKNCDANSAFALIETETHKLFEIKADRFSIGHSYKTQSFTSRSFEYIPGDTIYLFTDGLCDQFGENGNKKFKSLGLRQLLLEVQSLPMNEQGLKISETINQFKGKSPQIDDMLVIGIAL